METKTSGWHVLLIDDDADDCQIFEEVIHQIDRNVQLTILNDCYNLQSFLSNLNKLPDIVFLDINLPGKDGLECIDDIKASTVYNKLRIIVYCGVLTTTMIDKAVSKGADSYFCKPSSVKELHNYLQQILTS